MRLLQRYALTLVIVAISYTALTFTATTQDTPSSEPPIVAFIDGDIWTYSPQTDTWNQHTNFGHFHPPVLAPDGSQIAFWGLTPDYAEFLDSGAVVGDTPPKTELWLMDLPDGQPARIAWQDENNPDSSTLVNQSSPDFAPDGSLLAWTELHLRESWSYRLAVYDRESGEITRSDIQFPEPFGGFPAAPAIRFRDSDSAALIWPGVGRQVIAAFNFQGKPLTPVVALENIYTVIDFAPLDDGEGTFAVLTDPFGWLRVDFVTEKAERLTPPPAFGTQDRLLMFSQVGEAYWTTITGGETQQFAYDKTTLDAIAISPDSRRIVYAVEGGLAFWQAGDVIEIAQPDRLTPTALLWSPFHWFADVPELP